MWPRGLEGMVGADNVGRSPEVGFLDYHKGRVGPRGKDELRGGGGNAWKSQPFLWGSGGIQERVAQSQSGGELN